MRIATFNANSIRARLDITMDWLKKHKADILCVQETKAQDQDFPEAAIREQLAEIIGKDVFLEIFAKASLEQCRKNDKTGLFAKAERGEIRYVPGIDIPYEKPQNPDLTIKMAEGKIAEAVNDIVTLLHTRKFIESEQEYQP